MKLVTITKKGSFVIPDRQKIFDKCINKEYSARLSGKKYLDKKELNSLLPFCDIEFDDGKRTYLINNFLDKVNIKRKLQSSEECNTSYDVLEKLYKKEI